MSTEIEFERGRRETFAKMRLLLGFNSNEFANIIIRDSLQFGEPAAALSAYHKSILITARTMRDYCVGALSKLEQGETALSLTGAAHIPTYRHITGGDYKAGVLSAAEDLKVMIFSFDTASLIAQIRQSTAGAQKDARLNSLLSYACAVLTDVYLLRIEEKIVAPNGMPQQIAYDNGAVHKTSRLKKAFNYLSAIEHPTGPLARRAARIKPLWPPFKTDPQHPANNAPGFKAGYYGALNDMKNGLSALHQAAILNDYTKQTGAEPDWKTITHEVAESSFPDLLKSITESLRLPAYGDGLSAADGKNAALARVTTLISKLNVKGDNCYKPSYQRALMDLQSFWSREAKKIVLGGTGNAPEPFGPGPL